MCGLWLHPTRGNPVIKAEKEYIFLYYGSISKVPCFDPQGSHTQIKIFPGNPCGLERKTGLPRLPDLKLCFCLQTTFTPLNPRSISSHIIPKIIRTFCKFPNSTSTASFLKKVVVNIHFKRYDTIHFDNLRTYKISTTTH